MGLQTNVKVSNNAFFRKLNQCAEVKARKASRDRAEIMKDMLVHREELNGAGRSPVWDGSNGRKSKGSHKAWIVKEGTSRGGVPTFYLNNPTTGVGGYQYPNILMYGTTKSKASTNAFWKYYGSSDKIVVGAKGRLYSSQLPNGIQPFIDKQKEYMKVDIRKAIGSCDD